MSIGRKIAVWTLSALFVILLFGLAIDIVIIRVAGNPKPVEIILDKSGVYNSIVPGLLKEAKVMDTPAGQVPLTDPAVRNAATSSLTPEFLRTNVNQALDSIYLWLDGKTAQPDFVIDVSGVRTDFADKVAAAAKTRSATLPVCRTYQIKAPVDAFNATCLPYGVTPDIVAAQVKSNILQGQGFLDKGTIRASDLKSSDTGQLVFSGQLKNLPPYYRDFKHTPIGLFILAILASALIILIYKPRLQGLRHVAYIIGGSGIFIVLFGLALSAMVSNKLIPRINLQDNVFGTSLQNVLRLLVHNLRDSYLWLGLIYVIVGTAAWVIAYYLQKKRHSV